MASLLGRLFGFGASDAMPAAQLSDNDRIRAALRASGDDGTAIRQVVHYAYPEAEDAVAVDDVRDTLAWIAPRVVRMADGAGLRLEQEREVASEAFDAMTEQFKRDLAAIGWSYDGWECAVVTGDQ